MEQSSAASMRLELIERLNGNLSEYFDTLRGLDGQEIADMSLEIATMMEAHYYLSDIHSFSVSETQYLLQFQNPLEVVADEFQTAGTDDRSDIMWKIFDRQDALQSDYPLVNEARPAMATPEKETVVTRDGDAQLGQIAKMHCRVETLETQGSDRLDFHEVSVWGLKAALEEAFEAGAAHQLAQDKTANQLIAEPPQQQPASGKPSLLAALRKAKESAAIENAHNKEKNAPKHEGPEL